ncbi:Neurochondrin [Parasponia andersonii]|uniref:Neurochondrin n=1 Tax=Parasponia andersonii TaxID=3476 RepID=A0A2P5DDF5_PARAD|nr:Neurochondrin [Parasponia andersonii]
MESQREEPSPTPALEDCLKLLKGERDEQRLAGLLLVTKFCSGDDLSSLRRVYDAVGVLFLDRLLRTGAGKGTSTSNAGDNRDAYLKLSITVLAAFCRVPDLAASQDMVSKIPLLLEILSKESTSSVLEECYEFLYLVSLASEDGVLKLYQSGGMKVLASHMSTFPDGSRQMELAMKLVQLLLTKLSLDAVCQGYLPELSLIVATIAKQFSVLHDAVKFEALHLLSAILSSKNSAPIYDALRLLPDKNWANYMRDGIVAILQNHVVPAEKLQALILAESMISILGERWLIGRTNIPNAEEPIPADRCLLLVLEQSRVEVAVLLNELAYLKYEASKSASSLDETIHLKQQNVAISFSLVEKIIKLISNLGENEGDLIDDSILMRAIKGLNETVGVVLEYLQDAKEHEQRKGDDLLASVRVIGSYLAETPLACKEKVRELLEYMLSVEGAEEPSPLYSVCFLLPLLCQLTMNAEGCKAVVSCGGHKAVIDCLIKLTGPNSCRVEDNGCIFLACDMVLNLLLKREQLQFPLDESTTINLLKALSYWTEGLDDPSFIMMASSICSLVFDFTSEDTLLANSNFDQRTINSISRLIARSLASWGQNVSNDANESMDLLEIVSSGYFRWAPRFPHVRDAVER